MATENNNKTLNVPNKREQSQTCLGYTERKEQSPQGNVPNLRFPEFSGEWTKTLLNNYLEENKERNKRGIFTKNHVLSVSGDSGIVNQIELLGRSFAGKSVLDYHVVRTGNIVYTKSPLKEYPYGIVKVNGGVDGIVSTLYAVYKVKETANGEFVEYYFGLPNRTNRYFKPIVRIGAKHDMKIGNNEVLANYVVFPCVDEQKRISDFIGLLDERIATQIKIIEKLESLIKGLCSSLFDENKYDSFVRLGDISEITNGNSDVQDALLSYSDGMYPFFDRSEDIKFLPEYLLDKEAIIYPGEGSEFYPRYYNGKFALHQRCYAIYDISPNFAPRYLYYFCKTQNSYFVRNAVGSTVASLRLDTFKRLNIPNTPIDIQKAYVQLLDKIESKIIDNKTILKKYEEQKKYLLSNLFI